MTKKRKQITTYPLRLPSSLKQAVREASRRDGTSINQFVTTAVAEKLSAMRTADFFAERAERADIEEALRLLRRRGGQPPNPADRAWRSEVAGVNAHPLPPPDLPHPHQRGLATLARAGKAHDRRVRQCLAEDGGQGTRIQFRRIDHALECSGHMSI